MGTYLSVDLGATSGRVIAGRLHDGRLAMTEIHRFRNESTGTGRHRRWDVPGLFEETLEGLRRAVSWCGDSAPTGVAVTAWGVDVGVVDAENRLLTPVEHYRAADAEAYAGLVRRVGEQQLFVRSGVLPQQINTVFRLPGLVRAAAPPPGSTVLLVPDLWCALLTGVRTAERSVASTTGLARPGATEWDTSLLEEIGVDPALLPPLVDNGLVAGLVRPELAERIGSTVDLPYHHVASHDTASAAGVVGGQPSSAFISCGTWSLMGIEREAPVLSPEALRAGFTNEAGIAGGHLFLRNLTGLWLLEEAVRRWREQGLHVDVPALLAAAEAHGPVESALDIGAPSLVVADDVLAEIGNLIRAAGMTVPGTPVEVTRCILQSLALGYRRTLEECRRLTGANVETMHMTGGGSRSALLRRLTADACGTPVVCGPAEATSHGNVLVQALATGELQDRVEIGAVVRRSEPLVTVAPERDADTRQRWRHLDTAVPTTTWSPA